MSATLRLYRWLLRLCSAALRREYGEAMEDTFARRLDDARAIGQWQRLRLVRRELASLIALAITDRTHPLLSRTRKATPMMLISAFGRELRHAARRLARSPGFTLATVLTLALAIGANASIFAVVQRVVLNPLPYPDSDRIIALDHGAAGLNMASGLTMTPGIYFQYLDQTRTLDSIALYQGDDMNVTGAGGTPERLRVMRVTPSLASVLRIAPIEGRWFAGREGEPGGPPAVVLSHDLWLRSTGGDRGIIGRVLMLDGVSTTVVGVMPAGFVFPSAGVDAWLPEPVTRAMGIGIFNYSGVARLRDGVTLAAARADLNAAIADLPRAYPSYADGVGYNLHLTSTAMTLKEFIVGRIARTLWILLASVGLVLLVACANVANLFLVRSESREREVAVRRALGASGGGIARFFLAESVLLSIVGGVCGLALASVAVHLLIDLAPASLPRRTEVQLDGVVVAFTAGVMLLVGLAFGTMPLLRSAGGAVAASLHEGGRGSTTSRRRHYLRRVLMGAQVAFALVLLVASGLMMRSFQKLRTIDPGFDAQSTLTFRVGLPKRAYPDRRAAVAAWQATLDRLSTLPGVKSASATTCLPLATDCGFANTLSVEGRPMPKGVLPPLVTFRGVAGEFIDALGLRLRAGRGLARRDIDRDEPVVVINEALIKAYFPNEPIEQIVGRRIASNSPLGHSWLTIVGIVANTPVASPTEPLPVPSLYMPMSRAGGPDIPSTAVVGPDVSVMSYVIRTSTPPLELMASARHAIDTIDRNLPIVQVQTLQDILDRAGAQMAFTLLLLGIAAGVALLLGIIGIYGVMSYIVSQRTNEIGIRMALGADPGQVARAVVAQGTIVAATGVAVGLVVALAMGRLLESLLYGISPRDPAVLAATTTALLVVAAVACWIPARRAASIDPTEALRTQS